MPEIEPADPEARRRALFWLAGGFALGLVAIVGAERYRGAFEEWILEDPAARTGPALLAAAVVFVVPTLGIAGSLWRTGNRTLRASRFPPPGTPVVRDTPVLEGVAAERRGRLFQLLAALLVLVTAGFSFFWSRLAASLTESLR